jgi:hypothetical protein
MIFKNQVVFIINGQVFGIVYPALVVKEAQARQGFALP